LLVDDTSDRELPLSHFGECVEDRGGLRHELREAKERGDVVGCCIDASLQQVLDEEHAKQIIEVTAGDGKPRVAGRRDGLPYLVHRDGRRQRHDVDTRGHHVTDRPVGEVEQGVDDLPFDLLDLAIPMAEFGEGSDVGIGHRARIAPDGDPQQSQDPASDGAEERRQRGEHPRQLPYRWGHREGETFWVAGRQGLWCDLAKDEDHCGDGCGGEPRTPLLSDKPDEQRCCDRSGEDIDDVVGNEQC
jgi:hypothetical protein